MYPFHAKWPLRVGLYVSMFQLHTSILSKLTVLPPWCSHPMVCEKKQNASLIFTAKCFFKFSTRWALFIQKWKEIARFYELVVYQIWSYLFFSDELPSCLATTLRCSHDPLHSSSMRVRFSETCSKSTCADKKQKTMVGFWCNPFKTGFNMFNQSTYVKSRHWGYKQHYFFSISDKEEHMPRTHTEIKWFALLSSKWTTVSDKIRKRNSPWLFGMHGT